MSITATQAREWLSGVEKAHKAALDAEDYEHAKRLRESRRLLRRVTRELDNGLVIHPDVVEELAEFRPAEKA